jgi:hypothetical protein
MRPALIPAGDLSTGQGKDEDWIQVRVRKEGQTFA